MSKLVARKKGVKRTVSIGKVAPETAEQVEDLDGRIEAIQWLIPLGLQAVNQPLDRLDPAIQVLYLLCSLGCYLADAHRSFDALLPCY